MSDVGSVEEALRLIPGRAEKLNSEDDNLRRVIRHVEHALNELEPGVVATVRYKMSGDPEHSLSFVAGNKRWIIVWGDADEDIPLLNTPRDVRAEVFAPVLEGLSPIERLIIKVADNLAQARTARSPSLQVAIRLASTLRAAGYQDPGS